VTVIFDISNASASRFYRNCSYKKSVHP